MKKLALTVCLLAVLSVAAPYAMGQSTPDKDSPRLTTEQLEKGVRGPNPSIIERQVKRRLSESEANKRAQEQELANQSLLLAVLEKRTEVIEALIVFGHADIHYTLPQTENPSDLSQKILKTFYEKRAEFDFFKEISIYDVSPAVAAKAMGIEIKPRDQYTIAEMKQIGKRQAARVRLFQELERERKVIEESVRRQLQRDLDHFHHVHHR